MSDTATDPRHVFTQRRLATLRPYWLYGCLSLAAVLLVPAWFAVLLVSAIVIPRLLLPARLVIDADGLVLSAGRSERRIAWHEITAAEAQGTRWGESIRLTCSHHPGPVFLNIGYFGGRSDIVRFIGKFAGEGHPLTRAVAFRSV